MELKPRRDKPLGYRILRAVAIVLSAITACLFVGYAAWFVFSGPYETLLEDITLENVVMIGLIAVTIIFYFIAWYHPINASIIALISSIGYIAIRSVLNKALRLGEWEISLVVTAVLFLLQGLYKR